MSTTHDTSEAGRRTFQLSAAGPKWKRVWQEMLKRVRDPHRANSTEWQELKDATETCFCVRKTPSRRAAFWDGLRALRRRL